jgi:catechol 2,3-dioxygenase-like lactoylglutathione lyase family enzyme
LHHLALGSQAPERLAAFYAQSMGLVIEKTDDGWLGQALDRRVLFQPGKSKALNFAAFAVADNSELDLLRNRLLAQGEPIEKSPAALFRDDAICVRDPDGNRFVFGLPAIEESGATYKGLSAYPARLQHVVLASRQAARLASFFQTALGFALSDNVVDSTGQVRTSFLRCSDEHHSLAVFQAEENRLDHHCYEAGDWGLIKDWSDHLSEQRIPLVWGPGRHGPGNNLFAFHHDADGNWVELSAELERVGPDRLAGVWPHEERTLNRWGQGLLRS